MNVGLCPSWMRAFSPTPQRAQHNAFAIGCCDFSYAEGVFSVKVMYFNGGDLFKTC